MELAKPIFWLISYISVQPSKTESDVMLTYYQLTIINDFNSMNQRILKAWVLSASGKIVPPGLRPSQESWEAVREYCFMGPSNRMIFQHVRRIVFQHM